MKKIALLAFLMFGLRCASPASDPIEPSKPLRFVVVHTQDVGGYAKVKILLDTQTGNCYLITSSYFSHSSANSTIKISADSCEGKQP